MMDRFGQQCDCLSRRLARHKEYPLLLLQASLFVTSLALKSVTEYPPNIAIVCLRPKDQTNWLLKWLLLKRGD